MEDHAHHSHAHEQQTQEFLTVEETTVSEALSQIRASVLEASNPVGEMVDALDARLKEREVRAKRAAEARQKGYEGDACGSCGNFTLVRNGTCMKCNTCGSTSGCS
jgi:ribonucleoside-diphosphate reductase alpha chain